MSEKRETRLTPEEQELKERLMRSGPPPVRKGTGRVSKDPEGLALRYLLEDRREGR
jgi:hypothetical protein